MFAQLRVKCIYFFTQNKRTRSWLGWLAWIEYRRIIWKSGNAIKWSQHKAAKTQINQI